MSSPLISVVMSVRNGDRFLSEAVDSILDQSVQDFEFIIINDGSTDRTALILDSYQHSDVRLRVYHQENRGLIASLNHGCALARGKYIARMDADDVANGDRLLWQIDFMENHSEIGVIGGAVEFIDVEGASMGISVNPTKDHQIKEAMRDGCPFWHPTVLMRKSVLESVAGYRKQVIDAEDCDLWLRIAERSELANLETVVLKYRIHPCQVSSTKCRQQALSTLAAHVAAEFRRNGQPDPLDSIAEVTPEVLAALGVSEQTQESAVASRYVWNIRSMCDSGQYVHAVELFAAMSRVCIWKHAKRRVRADLRMLLARIYWRERRYLRSIVAAIHALILRPAMFGRPLKPLMRVL
jgi:glycosyltransferase involved in cell wall biosynthesis